jgi:hypothetical protein
MSGSKAVLVAMLALTACLDDFHLSARNLEIGPNPAVPGDAVVASVIVSVIPIQRHTIIVMIDNQEHLRLTGTETLPSPLLIQLGDAADLIAEYGTGMHSAHVEVIAEVKNESARTPPVTFELQQPVP